MRLFVSSLCFRFLLMTCLNLTEVICTFPSILVSVPIFFGFLGSVDIILRTLHYFSFLYPSTYASANPPLFFRYQHSCTSSLFISSSHHYLALHISLFHEPIDSIPLTAARKSPSSPPFLSPLIRMVDRISYIWYATIQIFG